MIKTVLNMLEGQADSGNFKEARYPAMAQTHVEVYQVRVLLRASPALHRGNAVSVAVARHAGSGFLLHVRR